MIDLISRQAAIENAFEVDTKDYGRIEVVGVDAILELSSAQPEIIRCKDCLIHGVCRFEQWLGLDGYCSQAERRIDD